MSFLPLQNHSLSLSPPHHAQQVHYNPYVSAYSTITTASPATTTPLTSALIPSHPHLNTTFFPPSYMDAGPTLPNNAATVATSPSTSNATVVNAPPQPSSAMKKKPGRGPGKKDIKDKPAVSVRWDDGDLTDRLIAAVETNDRWLGVFAQSSNDPNAARTAAPVAKRDLQREIARYLFGKDPRYELDDRKVLESLAVSVKNKLFKLTTLYTECKQELGQLCTLKDERELIPGSDAAATWARVKEKFPQYTRIRELMNRVGSPASTPRASGPDASVSPPYVGRSPISPVLRQRDTNAAPFSNGQVPHNPSSLKGATDYHRDASYDPSSMPSAQFASGPAAVSVTNIPSPTYAISNSTVPPLSAGFPARHSSQRRMTSSSTAPPNSSRPSTAVSQAASAAPQHSPQFAHHVGATTTTRATPYTRPSLPPAAMNELQSHLQTALDIVPEYDERDPSPPLSATIQHIVSVLTERKDRERARAHELEVLRMKRDEAEKSRWHQREMMRLKIQLLRAERAATSTPTAAVASSTPGAGPSQLGGVEEDLAIAAGLGDDMSMEGDGEGELDEDLYDPEPGAHTMVPHPTSGTR